jgi:hypothetical protein
MKRYSVAQARNRFSDLLDEAEAGDAVVIERRGTRFRLEAERGSRRAAGVKSKPSLVEYIDPVVLDGEWTWRWATGGVRFTARRKRR